MLRSQVTDEAVLSLLWSTVEINWISTTQTRRTTHAAIRVMAQRRYAGMPQRCWDSSGVSRSVCRIAIQRNTNAARVSTNRHQVLPLPYWYSSSRLTTETTISLFVEENCEAELLEETREIR